MKRPGKNLTKYWLNFWLPTKQTRRIVFLSALFLRMCESFLRKGENKITKNPTILAAVIRVTITLQKAITFHFSVLFWIHIAVVGAGVTERLSLFGEAIWEFIRCWLPNWDCDALNWIIWKQNKTKQTNENLWLNQVPTYSAKYFRIWGQIKSEIVSNQIGRFWILKSIFKSKMATKVSRS